APIVTVRLGTFDLEAVLRPPAKAAATVAVVDIDDASLLAVGQWPWPRDVLAGLVDDLGRYGARVVALDMLLAEPDRMPPSTSGTAAVPGGNDALLAAAMRRIPVVSGAALSPVSLPVSPAGDGPPSSRVAVRGALAPGVLIAAPSLVRPLPMLAAASQGVGVVNLYPGVDAAVRTVPGVVVANETLVPGLALETARVAWGAAGLEVEAPSAAGPQGVRVAGRLVPTDQRGQIRVDLRDSARVPTVPALRVMSGEAHRADIAGRVVIVGPSASRFAGAARTVVGSMPHALFQ